jgi:hypothetical protein
MNAADTILMDVLGSTSGFTANQLAFLHGWWQATRNRGEGLAPFLARQKLVTPTTARLFRLIGHGKLTANEAAGLLDWEELNALRFRFPDRAAEDYEPHLPSTSTFLHGAETERDPAAPVTDSGDDLLRVGTHIGRYLLTEWIGEGGFGTVYRALHPTLQIPVAVKMLLPGKQANPELLRRLKAEAQLLARLSHPHVVRIFDFEPNGPFPFLVLEYINGPSLADLIAQSGRLCPARGLTIMRQVAIALSAVHQIGIVHRDVKPANILLTRDGDAKLTDMGLALICNKDSADNPLPADARVGTVSYVAPELVTTPSMADQRSDLYSFGATFFHALTGLPPFEGDTVWQILSNQSRMDGPDPRVHVPQLPAALAQVIRNLMRRNPVQRIGTFEELIHILAGIPDESMKEEGRPKFWRWWRG